MASLWLQLWITYDEGWQPKMHNKNKFLTSVWCTTVSIQILSRAISRIGMNCVSLKVKHINTIYNYQWQPNTIKPSKVVYTFSFGFWESRQIDAHSQLAHGGTKFEVLGAILQHTSLVTVHLVAPQKGTTHCHTMITIWISLNEPMQHDHHNMNYCTTYKLMAYHHFVPILNIIVWT